MPSPVPGRSTVLTCMNILQRPDIHDDRDARAVGTLDEHLHVLYVCKSAAHHVGHRTLLVWYDSTGRKLKLRAT